MEVLKDARKAKFYTQKALAEVVGVTTNYIYMLEIGTYKPGIELAKRLGDALDIDWVLFFK